MQKLVVLTLLFLMLFLVGCMSDFPLNDPLKESYTLIDQDSNTVNFPKSFSGSVIVAGFVFVNCPDICPLTTHNMQAIQDSVNTLKMKGVEFVAITFDPKRDRPPVLKKYLELREINEKNFRFLTGDSTIVSDMMKRFNIVYVSGDTTYTEDGDANYFYTHTDRITLLDQKGTILREYKGSTVNIGEVINDLKKLTD